MAYGPNDYPAQKVPEPEDNWRHRTSRMRCGSCMWFVIKPSDEKIPTTIAGMLGRCRRHSPTLGGFPAVFSTDWCGDHKLDENK